MSIVKTFLDAIPEHLRREVVSRERPHLLEFMKSGGAEWSRWGERHGFTPPPALIALSDAMFDVYIHVRTFDHGWDLLSPQRAEEAMQGIARSANNDPDEFMHYVGMTPVFGQDSDYLVLDKQGRVFRVLRDGGNDPGPIAENFDELLAMLLDEMDEGA